MIEVSLTHAIGIENVLGRKKQETITDIDVALKTLKLLKVIGEEKKMFLEVMNEKWVKDRGKSIDSKEASDKEKQEMEVEFFAEAEKQKIVLKRLFTKEELKILKINTLDELSMMLPILEENN